MQESQFVVHRSTGAAGFRFVVVPAREDIGDLWEPGFVQGMYSVPLPSPEFVCVSPRRVATVDLGVHASCLAIYVPVVHGPASAPLCEVQAFRLAPSRDITNDTQVAIFPHMPQQCEPGDPVPLSVEVYNPGDTDLVIPRGMPVAYAEQGGCQLVDLWVPPPGADVSNVFPFLA